MRKKSLPMLGAILFVFAVLMSNDASGQIELPEDKVSWKFSVEQDGDVATIVATITTIEGWHINSIVLPEMSFGYASSFKCTPSKDYKKLGKVWEPKAHVVHDEESDETLSYHEGTFKFKQKIQVKSTEDFKVKGVLDFQTCNDVKCLRPHAVNFEVDIKGVTEEVLDMKKLEASFVSKTDDEAKDKDGNVFVKVNGKWHAVPEGNSVPFYKKYLKLEARDEE